MIIKFFLIFFLSFSVQIINSVTCTEGVPPKDDMPFCDKFINFPIDISTNISYTDSLAKEMFKNEIVGLKIKYNVILSPVCLELFHMVACFRNSFFSNCYNDVRYNMCKSICYDLYNNTCYDWAPGNLPDCHDVFGLSESEHCTKNKSINNFY